MTGLTLRRIVVPAYLLACLLIGGSVQNIWFNATLQMGALAILFWAFVEKPQTTLSVHARHLVLLASVLVVLVLAHLVPLPFVIWASLPGRVLVANGLSQLGLDPGWQTISLAPYDTITAGLTLLPPLCVLAGMIRLQAFTRTSLAAVLLVGTALGLLLGFVQISSANATEGFYLQPEHNIGTASGFFANPNHMATLLLLSLPYLAAVGRSALDGYGRDSRGRAGVLIGLGSGASLALIGLLLNRSLAGLALGIPVLLLSGLILFETPRWFVKSVFFVSGLTILAFVLALLTPLDRVFLKGDAAVSVLTRQNFLATGVKVAGEYFPAGSGVGTFERVYRMKENSQTIDPSVYVNHAHNEYLEALIETGLPGLLLIGLFLIWFTRQAVRLVTMPTPEPFSLAGSIACWVILVHSLVDYPLRTSAIAAAFAMSLGFMVLPSKPRSIQDFRPARHIEIA